jgi:phage shock protein A
MTVIKKLVTLLRGSAREIGESVVDSNATRIYEQEIIDAKHSIEKAKGDLTGVMAKEMQSAREIERLKNEVSRYEGLALEALNKTQEGLALDVASKVGLLEQELEEQAKAHASYALQVAKLKELIKSAEARIREHEREINIAKTTESVYRATQSISENIGSGERRQCQRHRCRRRDRSPITCAPSRSAGRAPTRRYAPSRWRSTWKRPCSRPCAARRSSSTCPRPTRSGRCWALRPPRSRSGRASRSR